MRIHYVWRYGVDHARLSTAIKGLIAGPSRARPGATSEAPLERKWPPDFEKKNQYLHV